MKKHRFTCWFAVLSCLLILPALAFGSGFSINEMGTKAVGMGGAFAAQADDPSAVYYNPAGIVQLDGTQTSIGFAIINPNTTFTSSIAASAGLTTSVGKTVDLERHSFFIPNLYVTHKYNDKVSFGFGTFANFGLGTYWPHNWDGRYLTSGSSTKVETLSLNPVVAFKPMKKLSIAVGPVMQSLDIEIQYKLYAAPIPFLFPTGGPDGDADLKGDKDWDYGVNVGLLYWITDDLKLGLSYRSRIKHKFDGSINISGLTGPYAAGNTSQGAKAELTLPSIIYAGLAWTTGPFTLEFDTQWTEWSTYDKLEATFDTLPTLSKQKNWDDVFAYRFGVNYKLNELFNLRAGLIYDESPIPDDTVDVSLPSGDRWLYTLGAGYHCGNMKIDFAYNYLDDEGRTLSTAAGTYTDAGKIGVGAGQVRGTFDDVSAHIFMLNFSYAF